MGSSKFEFETYKTKRFKTNKLGEREYIIGCVPYKISPLVCHREDAVRKEHSIFLLVRHQIGRRQHGPPLTAMCKVRAFTTRNMSTYDLLSVTLEELVINL